MNFLSWLPILLGSGITMYFLTKGVFALLRQYHIVDKPHLYPHEKGRAPLPYPGGVVLVINLLLWMPWIFITVASSDIKKAAYIIFAGLVTTIIMAIDDQRRIIAPWVRLFYQIVIGAFFGLTAIKIGYVSNIFGGIIPLDQFQMLQWQIGDSIIYLIPFVATIIWFVLVMNAINWSDNGRAMTSSVSLATMIVLAGLSLKLYFTDATPATQNNSLFVLAFLAILIPTVLIFWRFDTRRACIIGDAGTMFLGMIIASLALVSGGKMATVSIVLGLYFIDAFYVILRRIYTGKNPFKGDLTHLHHRMSELGISSRTQRYLVMGVSLLFGMGAIFLGTWGKIILFILLIICVAVLPIIGRSKSNSKSKREDLPPLGKE